MRLSTSVEGTATAGSLYSLSCVVSRPTAITEVPEIILLDPSGMQILGQGNVTEVGIWTVNTATTEFDPLLASHNGVYTCEVTFLSPLLEQFNLSSFITLNVQRELISYVCLQYSNVYSNCAVPPPRVTVSTQPGSIPFYAGSTFSLFCNAEVNASVDIAYIAAIVWLKSGAEISSDSRRIISNITQLSPHTYQSSLVLSPLSSTSDTGTYTCRANISPAPTELLVQGTTQMDMEVITVQGTDLHTVDTLPLNVCHYIIQLQLLW